MIEIRNLTKRYGRTTAVDHLTVTVQPGRVTGFLGPNGAGKSTTMRAIVGLDRPTDGEVLIGGRRYADAPGAAAGRRRPAGRPSSSTPAAAPSPICGRWPSPTACLAPASSRCWTWSA